MRYEKYFTLCKYMYYYDIVTVTAADSFWRKPLCAPILELLLSAFWESGTTRYFDWVVSLKTQWLVIRISRDGAPAKQKTQTANKITDLVFAETEPWFSKLPAVFLIGSMISALKTQSKTCNDSLNSFKNFLLLSFVSKSKQGATNRRSQNWMLKNAKFSHHSGET